MAIDGTGSRSLGADEWDFEDLWRRYYAVQLDAGNAVQMAFFQEKIGRASCRERV